MTRGRQDQEARSHRSAMGGKYVTRYFEENAKKYRESPDKTGRFDGAGLGGGIRQGGRESSDFCAGMFEAGRKISSRTGRFDVAMRRLHRMSECVCVPRELVGYGQAAKPPIENKKKRRASPLGFARVACARRQAPVRSAAPDAFGQRADATDLGRIEPRARGGAVDEHLGRVFAPEQVAVEFEGRHAEHAVRDRLIGVRA